MPYFLLYVHIVVDPYVMPTLYELLVPCLKYELP